MDKGGPTKGSYMDVRPPGAAAAPPTSRPVFTNDQPTQADPMMSTNPGPLNISASDNSSASALPEPPVLNQPQEQSTSDQPNNPESTPAPPSKTPLPAIDNVDSSHQFSHAQPFSGEFKKRGKAKKALIFLLVLSILGGGAYAAWYFVENKKSPTPVEDSSTWADNDAKKTSYINSEGKAYTSKLGGFSLVNKYDWKVTETDKTKDLADIAAQSKANYVTNEFTINASQRLVIDVNPGGRGGDCEPKTGEVAFAAGNFCPSYELLSADKLPELSYSEAKRSDLALYAYLVKYKIRQPAVDDKTYTFIGIDSSRKKADGSEEALVLNKPVMGGYAALTSLPLGDNRGYIDIKIVDVNNKPTQLSDQDLSRLTEVLKTFKVL